MTISVTPEHIAAAVRNTLVCPVFLALRAVGYDVQMVGAGVEHFHSTAPCGRVYYLSGADAIIQTLPLAVVGALKGWYKTGSMEPFVFDLPNP